MLKKTAVEPRDYREAMSYYAGAVQIVTTDGNAGRRGATVIAACSVSDEPPTVLVCLARRSAGNDFFAMNGVFALNTLSIGHVDLAHAFSGATGLTQPERFALGRWTTLATGSPVLEDAAAVFDCEVVEFRQMSTHRILFGKVLGVRSAEAQRPLMYHRRTYCAL